MKNALRDLSYSKSGRLIAQQVLILCKLYPIVR